MMSEELVLGILLQDFHDQNLSGCATLELDPESLLLYGKSSKSSKQSCAGKQVSQAGDRGFGLISVQVMFPVLWRLHSPCPPRSDWVVGGKSWKKQWNYKDEDCWMFSCCSSHAKPHISLHNIISSGISHFIVFTLLCFMDVAFFTNQRQGPSPAKRFLPALLRFSLYRGGLQPKAQFLWGMNATFMETPWFCRGSKCSRIWDKQ